MEGNFSSMAAATVSKGTGSLLTNGTVWVKEGVTNETELAAGSKIKAWAAYGLDVNIPLAVAGTSGDAVELRIFGTGTDPDGIGATWYLWDLKIDGTLTPPPGEDGTDGYTYVTDNALAASGGATLTMSGSVYDAGSGLAAAPTYALTNTVSSNVVSSGSITFSTEPGAAASTRTNC